MADTAKITIDGTQYEAPAGANLLQFCVERGLLVPHFCWHEALGPVGSCRLCAAMIAMAPDKPARLDMTCMTRIADGMVVRVNDDYARNFRRQVIEDLMLNHPHDCPVCDEGGECMLQDMTVLSEHAHRRTRFPKHAWRNQDLGPLIWHEMNRCITCYRCVRYYRDYALGDDFGSFGSRSRMYFGRVVDGVLESEFAGNLVDVCPTGVFTDKRFRAVYSRPWDLQTAHSVCPNCSVGCNALPGLRHHTLRRIKPASNPAVNKFFICDRGRYGGEFVNSAARLTSARVAGKQMPLDAAIEQVAEGLISIAKKDGAGSIAALGSSRSTLEANAALALIMRTLQGRAPAYFSTDGQASAVRLAAQITASREFPTPGLPEIEKADLVLNVGGDLTGEAPMIDLSVRQSIRVANAYFSISPRAGKLDQFARAQLRRKPTEIAAAVREVAAKIGSSALHPQEFATAVSAVLATAKRPVILCSALHEDVSAIAAARDLARQLHSAGRPCGLAYYYPAANSAGVALVKEQSEIDALWVDVKSGKIKALIVLERDAATELAASARDFEKLAEKCEFAVCIDSFDHVTARACDAVLPCTSYYESFGTVVNYELRAQRTGNLRIARPVTRSSSEVLLQVAQRIGAGDTMTATDFHDLYEIDASFSPLLDQLSPGIGGVLLKSSSGAAIQQSQAVPAASTTPLNRWDIISTFGSEELSSMSPPIVELAPEPGIEVHADLARSRGWNHGEEVAIPELAVSGKLHINPGMAPDTVGVRMRWNAPIVETIETAAGLPAAASEAKR